MGKFDTTHSYSRAQRPDELIEWAEKAASGVISMCTDMKRHPIICYSGSSGIAVATALSLELIRQGFDTFGMAYVRKKEESSHGRDVEVTHNMVTKNPILLFVDDRIASGYTRRRTLHLAYDRVQALRWGKKDFDLYPYLTVLEASAKALPVKSKTKDLEPPLGPPEKY